MVPFEFATFQTRPILFKRSKLNIYGTKESQLGGAHSLLEGAQTQLGGAQSLLGGAQTQLDGAQSWPGGPWSWAEWLHFLLSGL